MVFPSSTKTSGFSTLVTMTMLGKSWYASVPLRSQGSYQLISVTERFQRALTEFIPHDFCEVSGADVFPFYIWEKELRLIQGHTVEWQRWNQNLDCVTLNFMLFSTVSHNLSGLKDAFRFPQMWHINTKNNPMSYVIITET